MSIVPNQLELKYWPDPCLSQRAEEVNAMPQEVLEQLVADMICTMDHYKGIGIAAPQVGINRRLFIIRIEPQNTIVFVNPTITVMDDTLFNWDEGCLSVPGYFNMRERPRHIKVDYQDVNGEEQSTEFVGLYAFAIQHEYDHLEGKMFVDGASRLKQSRIKSKMKKYKIPA